MREPDTICSPPLMPKFAYLKPSQVHAIEITSLYLDILRMRVASWSSIAYNIYNG